MALQCKGGGGRCEAVAVGAPKKICATRDAAGLDRRGLSIFAHMVLPPGVGILRLGDRFAQRGGLFVYFDKLHSRVQIGTSCEALSEVVRRRLS
jgi:hypothetical protein